MFINNELHQKGNKKYFFLILHFLRLTIYHTKVIIMFYLTERTIRIIRKRKAKIQAEI